MGERREKCGRNQKGPRAEGMMSVVEKNEENMKRERKGGKKGEK